MATKNVIEPIFEADFEGSSYGFRPKRSATQALEAIRVAGNQGKNYVVDADMKGYFDSIDPEKLMVLVDRLWAKKCGSLGVLIRYADDFVVMSPTESQAKEALRQIQL